MKIILKGITSSQSVENLSSLGLNQLSFDLRPKSFNFTQQSNINKIITTFNQKFQYSLLFENEKEFMIKEAMKPYSQMNNVFPEFCGSTPLEDLEKLNTPYFWHFHDREKIKNISKTLFLKRIIFHQTDLEYLNSRGELFGFFQLFSDYYQKVEFEIQLDWNSEIFLSLLDSFNILILSYEINSKVEKGYQIPDTALIKNYIEGIKDFIEQRSS